MHQSGFQHGYPFVVTEYPLHGAPLAVYRLWEKFLQFVVHTHTLWNTLQGTSTWTTQQICWIVHTWHPQNALGAGVPWTTNCRNIHTLSMPPNISLLYICILHRYFVNFIYIFCSCVKYFYICSNINCFNKLYNCLRYLQNRFR